jgi:class 3 adenylate cyclase
VCGIGIALDTVTGFYPDSGTKEYDLYGPAITLATRYENMRKMLFDKESERSLIIIQEIVYRSLDPSHREDFQSIRLKERGILVRDDPAAELLYFRILTEESKASLAV